MTADELARIHAQAMTVPAPWSAADFEGFLSQPAVFLVGMENAFALGRVVLDEAELLTLAVAPAVQRQGLGRRCLQGFETEAAAKGAITAFLEVAATNSPAIALYSSAGWQQSGRRKAYYTSDPQRIDAILMTKRLTPA